MIARRAAFLVVLAGSAAAPLAAAPYYTWSGLIDVRAGYGENPGLTSLNSLGTGFVGGTLSGTLVRTAGLGTTSLTANVDLTENFAHYGLLDNYNLLLSHSHQITPHLSLSGSAGYQNTINQTSTFSPYGVFGGYGAVPAVVTTLPAAGTAVGTSTTSDAANTATTIVTTPVATGVYDAAYTDYLAFGQRNQRYFGNLGGSWSFSSRDSINFGGNYSHSSYGGRFDNHYDQYGVYGGYQRVVNARTTVGVQLSRQWIDYPGQPTSTADNISLTLSRKINAHWSFNGAAGLLINHSRGIANNAIGTNYTGPVNYNAHTLSLSAALCGSYTRLNVCITGSRGSAPSGVGGLRVDTNVGTTFSYHLTERGTLNGQLSFDHSTAGNSAIPRQNFYAAQGGYNRSISRRISLGVSGRYYRRDFNGGSALLVGANHQDGWSASGDIIYRVGRF